MPAIIGILVLGSGMGSLINYLADVLPIKRRITNPFCLNCSCPQSLSNYFLWPRRCQNCGKRRKLRVWTVEVVFSLASLYLWFFPPVGLAFWLGWFLLAYLFVVLIIDVEHRLVLHSTSIFGVVLAAVCGIYMHGLLASFAGGAAGYAIMGLFYLLGVLFIRLLSRWRGAVDEVALGYGDVNLAGITGLILGWPGITAGLMIAILAAGAAAILALLFALVRRKYHPYMVFPFAPFIIAAAVFLVYF